jgi:O-antigen ligase
VRTSAESALSNPFAGPILARGAFALMAFLIIAPLFTPRATLGRAMRGRWYGLLAFGLYIVVGYLSVSYSTAPLVTAGKVFEFGILFMLLWVIAARPDAIDAAKRTLVFVLYLEGALVAVALAGFFLVPSVFAEVQNRRGFVFRETMVSPFRDSNGFSALGALFTALGVTMYFTRHHLPRAGRWLVVSALGTLSVILSSGRQGVVIWIVSLAVVTFVFRRELFVLVIAPLGAFLGVTQWEALLDVLSRNQVEGSLNTLTGRTVFWELAMEGFLRQPLTGYGFGAGSRYGALREGGFDQFTHLHNGFLEALVGVGLLGFIPFVVATARVVWWSLARVFRKIDVPYAIIALPLLIQNTVGLGFGGWLNVNVVLFGLLVVLSDVQGLRPAPDRTDQPIAAQTRYASSRRANPRSGV